eukprot:gene34378-42398_t
MEDPVTASDEIVYERASIQEWFSVQDRNRKGLTRALSSDLFKSLDSLMHMDLMSNLSLRAPQLVAIGTENNGKSSVLERQIGFPIFPRKRGLCTRCPIRVKLRRQAEVFIPVVSVRNRATGATIPGSEERVALEVMCEHVERVMNALADEVPGDYIISDREIMIEIRVPYCPNLDVLDLPGIVASPEAAHRRSMELTNRVIAQEKDHSIFLLVVDARIQVNTSFASNLVVKHGVQSKTIGVFTKMDFYQYEGDEFGVSYNDGFTQAMEAAERAHVAREWMGCANITPPIPDCKPVKRLLCTDLMERKLLQEHYKPLSDSGRVGMSVIRNTVVAQYEKFICNDWVPLCNAHLKKCFQTLSNNNANLGLPMPRHTEYLVPVVNILSAPSHVPLPFLTEKLLAFTNTAEVKDILMERVKDVCVDNDWVRLETWPVWEELDSLNESMQSMTDGTFAETVKFDKSLSHATEAEKMMHAQLTFLVASLASRSLSELFVEAILDLEDHKALYFLNLEGASLLPGEVSAGDKPNVCKLERFASFITDFLVFVDDKFDDLFQRFES